jgi:hypothetical protein
MIQSKTTATTFLRVFGGKVRQIVTVLSVGPVSAVCLVETVHPDGTTTQDRIDTLPRGTVPVVIRNMKRFR